jgi:hypothetical protein
LEVAPTQGKPTYHFKMKLEWLKEEDFVKRIKENFQNQSEYTPTQFHQNLKRAKKVAMQWEKDKKLKNDRILKEVEETLSYFYNSEGFRYINEENKAYIKLLEDKKRHPFGKRKRIDTKKHGTLALGW